MPGSGLKTVTRAVPGLAMSVYSIKVASLALSKNVVWRLAPFQRTTELGANPLPFTASQKPGPAATALEGEMEAAVGAGLLMVNVFAPDVPPPGAGLSTVTSAVPA